jgi:hypothetical protein
VSSAVDVVTGTGSGPCRQSSTTGIPRDIGIRREPVSNTGKSGDMFICETRIEDSNTDELPQTAGKSAIKEIHAACCVSIREG